MSHLDPITQWIVRNHPNSVDWRTEFIRLLGMVEQVVPSLQKGIHPGKAASGMLAVAMECGWKLLEHEEQPK